MQYLIDTHTLIWSAEHDPRFSRKAEAIFFDDDNKIYVSVASFCEMAIKINLGKLQLEDPLSVFIEQFVLKNDIIVLPVYAEHTLPLVHLPPHHKDPFDRIIIAQAMTHNMPVISKDDVFDLYPITRIW